MSERVVPRRRGGPVVQAGPSGASLAMKAVKAHL